MKLLIVLALACSLAQVALAQAPPPPPRPLIWSPPTATDLSEFLDGDSGFKAMFPGLPKKTASSPNNIAVTVYSVYRKGSTSAVTVTTFPSDIESRANDLYELYKQNLAIFASKAPGRLPNKKFVLNFDREVEVAGRKGREFGYVYDYYYTQAALLTVGNKVYEIRSDVTNWHILSDYNPEVGKAFVEEAERFRNSFSLVK
jgi:hypothetical protein